jgi:hypothetical protein
MELPDDLDGIDRVVWGRTPDTQSSPSRALRSAVARERGLRRLGGVDGPVPGRRRPSTAGGPVGRGSTHDVAVRDPGGRDRGAGRRPGTDRILDARLAAADVRPSGQPLAFGSGGTLLVRVAGGMGPASSARRPERVAGRPAGLHRPWAGWPPRAWRWRPGRSAAGRPAPPRGRSRACSGRRPVRPRRRPGGRRRPIAGGVPAGRRSTDRAGRGPGGVGRTTSRVRAPDRQPGRPGRR